MKRTGYRYRSGRAAAHYDCIVIGSGNCDKLAHSARRITRAAGSFDSTKPAMQFA